MMSRHIAELLLRRQRLISRSAETRAILARHAQVLAPPLALTDRSLAILHWLRQHPGLPIAVVLVVAVTRPRSIARWSGRLLWGWTLYRRIRAPLDALTSRCS